MGFSLYNIFKVSIVKFQDITAFSDFLFSFPLQAGLLVANGVAVLHPKRFLKQCKSEPANLTKGRINKFLSDGYDEMDPELSQASVKNQIVGLLKAVSYLKGEFFPSYSSVYWFILLSYISSTFDYNKFTDNNIGIAAWLITRSIYFLLCR